MDKRLEKIFDRYFCDLPEEWKERYRKWAIAGDCDLSDWRMDDDDLAPELKLALDTIQDLHLVHLEMNEMRELASRYRTVKTVVQDFLAISGETP